jgi:hypothetical protein
MLQQQKIRAHKRWSHKKGSMEEVIGRRKKSRVRRRTK